MTPPTPLRLALLSQSYPPMVSGAALVLQRLAQGLAGRGHQVLVLAASDRGPAYREQTGCLAVQRLRAWPNPLRVGQRFMAWPRPAVQRALREFRPDLIHLHDPTSSGLAGLGAGRELGVPVALTLHQLPWFVFSYLPNLPGLRAAAETMLWPYYAWWLRRCQAAITPSQTIAGLVAARTGLRPKAITNGVDLARFNPQPPDPAEPERLRQQYGLQPGLPVLLYAGRLDADKQVDLVLRAFALARRAAPAQLLVAGDGKQRPALMALAESLGIAGRCRFPGYVSAAGDLPGLYRLADLFVTASEVEIQSSVVLEAAASALPVVTVRASSMPEFIQDGVTGCLVPPRDVPALAARLAELLADPARARAMGQAAYQFVQAHSPAASLDAHERLYRSLLANRRA